MKRSKKEVLDADFAATRAGVLDVAAFLDRVDRGEGEADFRRLNVCALCIECLVRIRPRTRPGHSGSPFLQG